MSVSLPEEDVEFLDTYVHDQGAASRSATLHKAVGLLRAAQPGSAGGITIVPVTANTARIYPFQVYLPARQTGLQRDSKAPSRAGPLLGRRAAR